jgi:hypothetical protein
MPTPEQLQKVWLLSDTVLYPEAVSFLSRLHAQDCNPLPTSQINGLLNVAESEQYHELESFIRHQRERNWPPNKRDIKTFYTALEETLGTLRRKRLKEEFRLLDGVSASTLRQEEAALMALLAREFIQHLVAENGLLANELAEQRTRQRSNRR